MFSKHFAAFVIVNTIAFSSYSWGQEEEEKVRADRAKVEAKGFWLYNDLNKALQTAKRTGKPILVSLRCIPCEECVKLDDELIDADPVLQSLLKKFVCVRIVGTNGLDLRTFQYDTDQSFAMFMMNADKTVYGRFGTRSHRTEWVGDVSLEGMAAALKGAMALHANYPANKSELAGKRGKPLEFDAPEKYPTLRGKPNRLNYSGKVAASCIHCHQIGEARRDYYWKRSQPIPEPLMYPYPHPKSIGLILDPKHRAKVAEAVSDSPAATSGLKTGDEILRMNGQPLISMADVQWVLHHVPPAGGSIPLDVRRDGEFVKLQIQLKSGWRRLDDTSWRTSSWIMRRVALGGMKLRQLNDEERKAANVQGKMALTPTYLGQYGAYARARKAGFQKDDIITSFDGRNDLVRESDIFDHVNSKRRAGESVKVELLRKGKPLSKQLPIQK